MISGSLILDSISYSKIDKEFLKADGTFDYTINAWPLTGKKFSYKKE